MPALDGGGLFRLAAFGQDWLARVRQVLEDDPVRGRLNNLTLYGDHGFHELSLALAYEAGEWIALGQRAGFFPPLEDARVTTFGEPPPWVVAIDAVLDPAFRERARDELSTSLNLARLELARQLNLRSVRQGGVSAERLLAQAFAGLTPERLRFVGLILFADDRGWKSELQAVDDLVADAASAPWRPVAVDEMDRCAWAFEGADAIETRTLSPAVWRLENVGSADYYPHPALSRYQELQRVRSRLASVFRQWAPEVPPWPYFMRPTISWPADPDE